MVPKIPEQVVKEHTLNHWFFFNSFVKLTSYLRIFQKPELEVILILKILKNQEPEVNLILEPEVITKSKNCPTQIHYALPILQKKNVLLLQIDETQVGNSITETQKFSTTTKDI